MKTFCLFLILQFFYIPISQATVGIQLESPSAVGLGRAGSSGASRDSVVEALGTNPSLVFSPERNRQMEIGFGTLFLNVEAKNGQSAPFGGTNQFLSSSKSNAWVGSFGYSQNLSDRWSIGAGMLPEAGLTSDFGKKTELLELAPELAFLKIPVAVAYRTEEGFQVGLAPALGLAQYATNYSKTIGTQSQSDRSAKWTTGLGLSAGASWFGSEWGVGLSWRSKTSYSLREFADLDQFGPNANVGLDTLPLDSPEQWGLGVSWQLNEQWRLLSDLKHTRWGAADGFREFGWDSQWVGSLAAEHRRDDWTFRAGWSQSTPVFRSESGRAGAQTRRVGDHTLYESSIDLFNVIGYPAVLTSTATVGATWDTGETGKWDLGIAHSFQKTVERSGTDAYSLPYRYEARLSVTTVLVGYRYAF